jgi:ubiquinone/menaquinone biosynthesis C-methylase UbiE
MNVFDDMGNYWAEIADKNQTERQIQFLKSQLTAEGYILDLACGTGRHTIALNNMGFKLVGLDVSAKLLRIAKQRHSEIQVIRADMQFMPFKPDVFFGIISMDTSLGYLQTENEDKILMKELRKIVSKKAILIVDVFNRDKMINKYKVKKSASFDYPNFFLNQERKVNVDENLLYDLWKVCDKTDGKKAVFQHKVRLYKLDQLERLLEGSNFEVKQVFGDYECQEYNVKNHRLIIVAVAK